jgi:hypothetical protein
MIAFQKVEPEQPSSHRRMSLHGEFMILYASTHMNLQLRKVAQIINILA